MNIGIVTTWFERGASYVSRQYMDVLSKTDKVFIYARGGECYAKDDPKWNLSNVWWGKRNNAKFSLINSTYIDKVDFISFIKENKIEALIFNEQRWWQPMLWCKDIGVKTLAYIDYYNEETLPLFDIYDGLICNTHKHEFAFRKHHNSVFINWGVDLDLYAPKNKEQDVDKLVFFHSAGMAPERKGTDAIIKAYYKCNNRKKSKLIIHTQVDLEKRYPELMEIIDKLKEEGCLQIITKTVSAPGLYYMGDVYVYPSRLDGIGLTLAEASASGLACITVNNGPMNEFVNNEFGVLCDYEYLYCRKDGYFWPSCEPSVMSLSVILQNFIDGKYNVPVMKSCARKYAIETLNFNNNCKELHSIIANTRITPVSDVLKQRINTVDKRKKATCWNIFMYNIKSVIRHVIKK